MLGWLDTETRDQSFSEDDVPLLAMLSDTRALVGYGPAEMLPRGPTATLGRRVQDFFNSHPSASLVAGALPFERDALDCLSAVARVDAELPPVRSSQSAVGQYWSLQEQPSAAIYAAAVVHALNAMREASGPSTLRKVVLARSLLAVSDRPVEIDGLLRRLHADSSVTTFLVPLPPGQDGVPRRLVGATPELLVSRTGRHVVSHPLAGSAPRDVDPVVDQAARNSLAESEKDRREHALVAEFILDVLAPHCRSLAAPGGAQIRATRSMWHLGTHIEGELRDPSLSAADLAAMLHPTPAVCGVPRDRAAALISELEPMKRGFYAGAFGWCNRVGDGAWHVSIRCAELSGGNARLYAGAGIVPGSEPEAEVRETKAKFRAMLHALGVDAAAEAGA